MQIGTFRRQVGKLMVPKPVKSALRNTSKNTARTQIAQSAVGLRVSVGSLLQALGQYLLGLQQTDEAKQAATVALGDVGFDIAALSRVLKVKLPSSTKKIKLVGTRGAGILQLSSLATDLLAVVQQGLFVPPKTKTEKKMVTMPQKGGAKEERDVEVIDVEAETVAETARREQMVALLSGAIDVYWRLCFDITGKAPESVLDAKFARMQAENPAVTFDADKPPKPKTAKAKAPKKAAEKAPEAVTA